MNIEEQKRKWDAKYEQGLASLTVPDPFFIASYEKIVAPSFLPGDSALDLAGGLGRHALFMARKHWRVTLVELSDVAVAKVRDTAAEEELDLTIVQADAVDFPFPPASLDLIVLFYHFERSLFPGIASAIKPGGLLLSKMRFRWPGGDDAAPHEGLPDHQELPRLLPELSLLHYHERKLDRGAVVEFIAGK